MYENMVWATFEYMRYFWPAGSPRHHSGHPDLDTVIAEMKDEGWEFEMIEKRVDLICGRSITNPEILFRRLRKLP